MDVNLFGKTSPYSIFRNHVGYFDQFKIVSDSSSKFSSDLDLFKIDFRFYGGKCSDTIDDTVTHVITLSR